MLGQPGAKGVSVLAVDTGGTFTDLLLLRDGRIHSLKIPSTPRDPAEAVLSGIATLLGEREPYLLLHGSTVATNALLERKGARVVLVTNRGFEDVIEIGRQNRPQLYALVGQRLPPLVGREDRIGVSGRLGPDGAEIVPLDPDELERLPDRVARGESIAVCLLHSYANPEHERAVARALETLDAPISVSSDLLPEYREYERTSTTVVNAYVAPRVAGYLTRLSREAGSLRMNVMGSNGGTLPVARAALEPARTVLSGPAGGVVGARAWGSQAGIDRVLSFDMGGTSTDVSLCPERVLHTRDMMIAGQPVALPVLDIHTVGAGGGSLARVDQGGALRVGPVSAGADPGPICYGRGGTGVTVTDAHVWLGRLPQDAFLGGEADLDREAIKPHLRTLAEALGGTLDDTAEGILAVADSAMERALRVISVERGYDPADFAIVAFGGAGALHVAELTRRLGASHALVPPDPGLLSAYGMLAAPLTRESSRTVLFSTDEPGHDERMDAVFRELEVSTVEGLVAEGASRGDVRVERIVDARYRGQSFELGVLPEEWVRAFHEAHRSRYGYDRPDSPVEAVTLRVVARAPGPRLDPRPVPTSEGPPSSSPTTVRFWRETLAATRVRRADLRNGHELDGPIVVEEYSATTWVPPGWLMRVDAQGILHLVPRTGTSSPGGA
jgi:N-methylhydantoinase A